MPGDQGGTIVKLPAAGSKPVETRAETKQRHIKEVQKKYQTAPEGAGTMKKYKPKEGGVAGNTEYLRKTDVGKFNTDRAEDGDTVSKESEMRQMYGEMEASPWGTSFEQSGGPETLNGEMIPMSDTSQVTETLIPLGNRTPDEY